MPGGACGFLSQAHLDVEDEEDAPEEHNTTLAAAAAPDTADDLGSVGLDWVAELKQVESVFTTNAPNLGGAAGMAVLQICWQPEFVEQ